MNKDNALQILDIMYRLTLILFEYSKDLEVSIYSELEDCQADIYDLLYKIKEGDAE